jgi:hypothetical protein
MYGVTNEEAIAFSNNALVKRKQEGFMCQDAIATDRMLWMVLMDCD